MDDVLQRQLPVAPAGEPRPRWPLPAGGPRAAAANLLVLQRAHRGHGLETVGGTTMRSCERSAAISSTVTGCAKCGADPGDRLGNPVDSGLRLSNLRDTRADRCLQADRIRISSTTSGPRRSASSGPAHQFEQPRHGVDDARRSRARRNSPRIVRRLGNASRIDACGEFRHARWRSRSMPEAQKWISFRLARVTWPETGRSTANTSMTRGIVFENVTAKHHHLGALRHDAQRRSQRRVRRPRR